MVTSFKRSHAHTATPSDPTRDWPRLAMSVQESPAEAWVGSGAGLGALDVALRAWDLLKEVAIIFITSTIV